MSRQEIDDCLAGLEESKRSRLEVLRRDILEPVPEAEECISYGVPGFRDNGAVAGFAAANIHLICFRPQRFGAR